MVPIDKVRDVFGIIGNLTAIGIFLSPLPTFYSIWKKGTVEQFSVVPYLAALINCMLWVVYALPMVHPNSLWVLCINATGFGIEFLYVMIYIYYADNVSQRYRAIFVVVAEFVITGSVAILALKLVHSCDRRSMVVGILCAVFGSLMYAAPLSVMKLVIKTKSVEYMPFYLSFICFINGVFWIIYASLRFDIYVMIPNALGVVFAAAQLVLHAIYYKSTKLQIEARKNANIGLVGIVPVPDNKTNGHHNGHSQQSQMP